MVDNSWLVEVAPECAEFMIPASAGDARLVPPVVTHAPSVVGQMEMLTVSHAGLLPSVIQQLLSDERQQNTYIPSAAKEISGVPRLFCTIFWTLFWYEGRDS